jgi:hypothetical protein
MVYDSYAAGNGSYAVVYGSYAAGNGSYAVVYGSYAAGNGSYVVVYGSYAAGNPFKNDPLDTNTRLLYCNNICDIIR